MKQEAEKWGAAMADTSARGRLSKYKYNTLQSGGRWEEEIGLFHLKGKAHLLPPFACFSFGGFLKKISKIFQK